MRSAIQLVFGLSIIVMAVGCDNGGDDSNGPKAVAGSSNTSGSGSVLPGGGGGSGGSGGGGELPEGVPLTVMDGWVDGMGNTLGIQGAMFAYADPTSGMNMTEDFTGMKACISGTAAKVDKMSAPCTSMMFTPPATDCYGEYWGAAIGLNLNQPTVEMDGMMVGGDPVAYDASALTGFAFEISGSMVPTSLRFKVEDANGEYCTPAAKPLSVGPNSFTFADVVTECWKAGGTSAEGAKSAIIKIAWQVVTNDKSEVPFDFCVSNVRALQ